MNYSRVSAIKRNQKESLILKEFSKLFLEISMDHPEIRGLMVTNAELSNSKGFCNIFFYDADGEESFKQKLEVLKLYKPSIRSAMAKLIKSRYVPDFMFRYDHQFEKEKRVNEILDKVKEEDEI